jgi:tetratricopeptide (TPR) repeat protein/transcriptional regulator with XRE-family HTH domain
MAASGESDAASFGRLVRERRQARGWSLEVLAAEAFPGSTNKGYVSRIERGLVPNITRDTVRNVARPLGIDPEAIPPSLRWPEAVAAVRDTNTIAHQIQDQLNRLVAAQEDRSREFGIKEGMLIALARRYAEGSPGDFDTALAGLERALEVAEQERTRGRLPSNISDAVDAVIARIDSLNESGELDAGQAVLEAELKSLDEEDARRHAIRARLYEKGVAQAILNRDVASAFGFVIKRFDLEAPLDADERYHLFRSVFIDWLQRGEELGLKFDLEVAIALGKEALSRSAKPEHRCTSLNDLSAALFVLGERESGEVRLQEAVATCRAALRECECGSGPLRLGGMQNNLGNGLRLLGERQNVAAHLEESVLAYRAALRHWVREDFPSNWATAQSNLGNALQTLGGWERGTVLLKDAMTAYRAAMEVWTRDGSPQDWAMTQNNLGCTFLKLAQEENRIDHLWAAVIAFREAQNEWIRKDVPLDWAMTQNNLGSALLALGERERGTIRLRRGVAAFRRALEEWTRDRSPLDWLMAQNNLGNALRLLGNRTLDVAILQAALEAFQAGREVAITDWPPERLADLDDRIATTQAEIARRS